MRTRTKQVLASRPAAALLALALLFTQGCAGGDRFRPEQLGGGEAVIYVYRPGSAGAGPLSVFIDQDEVGRVGARQYLTAVVAPGEHLVRVRRRNDATRLIELAEGESAFLEANAPLFGGRISLARISNDIARERIAPATRVEAAAPTQEPPAAPEDEEH